MPLWVTLVVAAPPRRHRPRGTVTRNGRCITRPVTWPPSKMAPRPRPDREALRSTRRCRSPALRPASILRLWRTTRLPVRTYLDVRVCMAVGPGPDHNATGHQTRSPHGQAPTTRAAMSDAAGRALTTASTTWRCPSANTTPVTSRWLTVMSVTPIRRRCPLMGDASATSRSTNLCPSSHPSWRSRPPPCRRPETPPAFS